MKRANALLTFDAMAISEANKTLIALEAAKIAQIRKIILKETNLKIQWDKQGKHLVDHRNYEIGGKKSILTHKDPQKLVKDFAGKGYKDNKLTPGIPGYVEIVNFEEVIGYAVEETSGEKISTIWGKIHYAKGGVHIVPTKPR